MRIIIEDHLRRYLSPSPSASHHHRQGLEKVILEIVPDAKPSEVIAKYCEERGLKFYREFVIKKEDGEVLEDSKTLAASGVIDEDVLQFTLKYIDEERTFGFNNWIILTTVALFIGVAGIIAVSVLYSRRIEEYEYGVVLDAGSTHTQLYVYRWSVPKINNSGDVTEFGTRKCAGKGISSYASNPSGVGSSLSDCLAFAVDTVPSIFHPNTPISLGATAGMRLLEEVNKTVSDEIMSNVEDKLGSSPFLYDGDASMQAGRIISGSEEGAFSWLTVNYLLHDLHYQRSMSSGRFSTDGALDMGGASTQITFIPSPDVAIPDAYRMSVLVHGESYDVYTHSYLCYGKSEAERRYAAQLVTAANYSQTVPNPCMPRGNGSADTSADIFKVPCVAKHSPSHLIPMDKSYYFLGGSNATECFTTVKELFDFTSCSSHPNNCTFNNTYQPELHGSFLAFSSYFYTFDFLNLTSAGFQETRDKIYDFCSKPWDEIKDLPVEDPDYLPRYCFDSVYIFTLLVEGYKFSEENWDQLNISQTVSGSDLGWSLGFMLNQTNSLNPDRLVITNLSTLGFVVLLVLFCVFLVFACVFGVYAYRSKSGGRTHRTSAGRGYTQLDTDYGTA